MIKLIVGIKRKTGMSPEEFHDHWRTTHADRVRTNAASRKYIRKYVQCHTLAEEYLKGEDPYDSTAELWFDSLEDKDRFFTDQAYLENIHPDEARFADMTTTVFFVTKAESII